MIHGNGPCHRWISKTLLTIAEELTVDGLGLRYWLNQTDDGWTAGRQEGRFTICLFWLASAVMYLAVYSAWRYCWWPVWSAAARHR